MSVGDWLRLIMILIGVAIFVVTILSLAKRRLTEHFCVAWGFLALIFIIAGIFTRPTVISRYISNTGLILLILIAIIVLMAGYFVSIQISELSRKNRELTIQISLLNQENERILANLEKITGKDKRDL